METRRITESFRSGGGCREAAVEWATSHGYPYFECSSRNREGLDELFEAVAQGALHINELLPSKRMTDTAVFLDGNGTNRRKKAQENVQEGWKTIAEKCLMLCKHPIKAMCFEVIIQRQN